MKNKLFRIALILLGVGVFSALGTYLYVFHKPHRNIAKEKPAFVLDAKVLVASFTEDEMASYEKYGNKVLQVYGEIVDISISENSASILFVDEMEGVNCSFDSLEVANSKDEIEKLSVGDKIELKGQCDGFDMIMGVVLTRCVVLEKK